MSSVLQTDERSAKDINDKGFDGNQRAELYAQLKQREHVWWQARQQLTLLKESLFVIHTLIFIVMLGFKGRIATHLQHKINQADVLREEALNEMTILAADTLFTDVHAKAPISLQQIYEYYDAEFHLASLHRLLQREVDAGRLMLGQQVEAEILPLELADEELKELASEMVYKSVL